TSTRGAAAPPSSRSRRSASSGTEMTPRRLGRTDLEISPLGLGCWQFSEGKGLVGGFWEALPQDRVDAIVKAALDGGVTWFDTAEAYVKGRSERALAH